MTGKARICIAFTFLVALNSTPVAAREIRSPTRPLLEIAYRPVGKLIYLPVRINGSAPQWFCLDSGASTSIIDQAAARRASIVARLPGTIRGAGKGKVQADFAPAVKLTIGKLTAIVEPRIVDLGRVPLPVAPAGLLGAEFFERYVVRIDTDRHRIALFEAKTFRPPIRTPSIPLKLTNHRLYVQLRLEPRPGLTALRRVRLDTGSEDSVDDDSVRRSAIIREARLGNGLGSSYAGASGVYSSVGFGPYKFENVCPQPKLTERY